MNNKKCPNCGFINFLKDESCRKCNTNLDSAGNSEDGFAEPPQYAAGYRNQYQQPIPKKGFPLLKVFLCLFAGLIAFSYFTGAGARLLRPSGNVQWREFRPGGSSVSVMMPKEPTTHEPVVQSMGFGTITNHMYTASVNGQGSAVYVYADFSIDISSPDVPIDKLLDDELSALIKRTNSTLVSKQVIKVDGHPGLQFEMTPPSNYELKTARSFGKFFVLKNQLYLIGITAAEDSVLFSGRETFLAPTIHYF